MTKPIVKEYKLFLTDNHNERRARKAKQYLYSPFKHYGLETTKRRSFFNKYKKDLKTLTKKEMFKLASDFWKQNSFEEKFLALELLNLHKEKLEINDLTWIEAWARKCYGWALLDGFIIPLMPEILQQDKSAYSILEKWIKDKDFWIRRSALLAQLLFFRKSKTAGNRKLFFKLAESQFDESWIDQKYIDDKETRNRAKFFIRKAIGWTLREMSNKDPESVTAFLKKNKNKMSGLSYREGSRKLDEKYLNQL